MSINDELSDLFENIQSIIDDDFQFKKKLNIGDEHFTYLNNAKNLMDFGESLAGGTAIGFLTYSSWFASHAVAIKVLAFIPVLSVSPPIAFIVGSGILGATGFFGFKKAKDALLKKSENELMTKVPKYLNTPLDLLGLSLASLMMPVSVKMGQADGELCVVERAQILKYFTDEWGYNSEFIEKLLQAQESKMESFSYKEYAKTLKAVCKKTSEFKLSQVSDEILNFQREIILMDGEIHPEEEKELATLKLYLDA